MPVTEEDVAITQFLSPHAPIHAIVKQCVEDFVVTEVMQDGHLASITHLPIARPRTPGNHPRTRDAPDSAHGTVAARPTPPSDPSLTALDAFFPESGDAASAAVRALYSEERAARRAVLPVCADKKVRTSVHKWVRENMPGFTSESVGGAIRLIGARDPQARKRRRVEPPAPSPPTASTNPIPITTAVTSAAPSTSTSPPVPTTSAGTPTTPSAPTTSADSPITPAVPTTSADNPTAPAAPAAPADNPTPSTSDATPDRKPLHIPRGAILQFVLWKRGLDTNRALTMLGRFLHIRPQSFSYAGTKDKRGVTSQLVQARHVTEGALAAANARLPTHHDGQPLLLAGNLAVATGPGLCLGDLRGNRFSIVLRDAHLPDDAAIQEAHAAVHAVALRGFVNYFGLQRFGSGVSATHETGFAVLRCDFADVCRRLLLPLHVTPDESKGHCIVRPERTSMVDALDKFGRRDITAEKLLDSLPPRMTVECTIAQAFAHDEREGRGKYDYRAAFGKLPRNLRKMYGHAVQSYLWNLMASERVRLHKPDSDERMHAIVGDLVLVDEEADGEDLNSDAKVRVVTEEEERKRSVSVYRVLIPVVGSDVGIPDNEYAAAARQVVEDEQLSFSGQLTRELNISGAYRRLLAKPLNVEMRVVSYVDKNVPLVPMGIEHLKINLKNESKGKQGVMQADSQGRSGHGESVVQTDSTGNGSKPKEEMEDVAVDVEGAECKEETISCQDNGEGETTDINARKAMVLSFTLGCSEYATMMIREVTKQDSSTAGQKLLQQDKTVA